MAFALQALLLLLLGLASIGVVSSAMGDVADLNGVVRQQRLLLDARIAVIGAGDRLKAYALDARPQTENAARQAVNRAAEAVSRATSAALTSEQEETLTNASEVARSGPRDFERMVKDQNAIAQLVRDQIYVEGTAIQADLDRLSAHAAASGEIETANRARAASAAYSLVRIAMERFLSDSSRANIASARNASLALEDELNRLYESTGNSTLLAEADKVIKRLINYDKAFQSVVKLTGERDKLLRHLLDGHGRIVGSAVEEVGSAVESIQSGAASSAQIKLSGLFTASLMLGGLGVVFVLIASQVFRGAVIQPIRRITDKMKQLVDGDLDQEAAFTDRGDEVGEMARALEVFRLNAIEMKRLQGEEAERLEAQRRADAAARDAERRALEERQRMQAEAEQAKHKFLTELASRFENHVARAMDTVARAAREIDEGAQRVADTVASSEQIAATVTDAAVEASASTATIAAATEEMNLSLAEVSKQVSESSRFASRAVDRVSHTDGIVTSLARDAAEIGEVVSLVHNIAQQVNLLALNATIEASRAGEAGRGFAVVAAEVKSLAQQTAAATDRISERVGSIQNISQSAMQAINEIGQVIGEMGVLAASVAIAVEQQVSTTAEIARNTTLAATGTSQVTTHLRRVQEGVSVSGQAAESARIAAGQVSRQAEALQSEIERFLASVRAA